MTSGLNEVKPTVRGLLLGNAPLLRNPGIQNDIKSNSAVARPGAEQRVAG